ncbi:MAG: cyclic pyranopterin monophosphate synthase MoaC [Gammaproteobacteria bacterium]|nr:cyclic pyranopterin monophosphate synthase MoaC [Gammaproteobacteria bacterium]
MKEFNHFDQYGQAQMVDVGDKASSYRLAIAKGQIYMLPETLEKIRRIEHAKGDVLGVARIAAIQASKKTSEWIPLCHPLFIEKIQVEFDCDPINHCVNCAVSVSTHGKTGVEMEALCAVSAALLTIYDMCKARDRAMRIHNIHLAEKLGGTSGPYQAS